MMSPKDYPIKLTREQEEHINTLSPDAISAYLHEIEVSAGLRTRDPWNPDSIHIVEPAQQPADQPQQLSESFTVNGKSYEFNGTRQEIDQQQVQLFRSLSESARIETTNATVARDAQGRFAREEQPPKNNVVDPIVNGLVAKALKDELGISPEELQAVVEEKRNTVQVQSWVEATEAFKKGPGADWPGGDANKQKLGELLPKLELDGVVLTDMPDKVAALTAAFQYMKENNLFVQNPETERNSKIASASTPQEIEDILGITARKNAQALWGRR